jgi:hypothetical protein
MGAHLEALPNFTPSRFFKHPHETSRQFTPDLCVDENEIGHDQLSQQHSREQLCRSALHPRGAFPIQPSIAGLIASL